MSRTLDVATSVLASQLRGWRGTGIRGRARKQPEQPLQLYEFEASPFCRLVRERLTELDLDVMIYPCPQGGTRFRPTVKKLGGKQQYPFMVDPNTGTSLYESFDIIRYVSETYEGKVRNPRGLRRKLALATGVLAAVSRAVSGVRGYKARPSVAPEKPLELYSFESSPFSRLVREVLCELEIPYLLHNTGKARMSDMGPPEMRDKWFKGPKGTSRNRRFLEDNTGQVQVPYLIDPNTGVAMYESAKIIAYLEKTYAA
jgi:glutathione S-transferase